MRSRRASVPMGAEACGRDDPVADRSQARRRLRDSERSLSHRASVHPCPMERLCWAPPSYCQGCVHSMYSHSVSTDVGALRIGEFARRTGVSPELLRAWERRYGLLQPIRTDGGFRLYTAQDAERVARMRHALDDGLSAAEAARRALEPPRPVEGLLDDARSRLLAAMRNYDEATMHAVLDEALAAFAMETVLSALILPFLRGIGDEWERGELEVGQEHFASNLIRERLLGLARLWGRGSGPLAILACPPRERHDIGLIAFGLLLRSHGWRILFLGADTPLETLERTVASTPARLVVVASMDSGKLESERDALRRLAGNASLVLSGAGASDELCARLGVERLDGDLVAAAADVARRVGGR
jgi:DNA-binding transcriptional MerR regulator